METKCDLVKDLIPLYIENLCSEYSKTIVDEHTLSCRSCKRILNDLSQENMPKINKADVKKSIKPFKKIKRRNFLITISSVLAVTIIIAIFVYKLFLIGFAASTSSINITDIKQLDEMTFSIELSSNSSINAINSIYLVPSDSTGTIYIKVNHVLISPFNTNQSYETSLGFDRDALGYDRIKTIYLIGNDKNDVKLIWKEE